MSLNLTAERWRRLEALFQSAVELPGDAREPFIERETIGDPDLGLELRAMLAHDAAAAASIAGAVETAAQGASAVSGWIGRRVGPYRIAREIGRGGMGIVFEAVRDGSEFHKTVALKVTPEWRGPWNGGGHAPQRFRTECRILAGLEHPNIARFLDGGSEGGVPYLAMEYVEGQPITAWCRAQNPGLRQRIELFRRVCGAVEYAHENMIVHRDLKPANILVDRGGEPKLLDFGIAKLLGPLAEEETATTGARLWTPDYTSPEQVRGGAITARTDVYSLGLILYELLSGERAQAADSSSAVTLDRSICETEAPAASVHDRRLRGDLDTIIAMAIRKEPVRRYNSAAALSDDLGRYLDGKPVLARPSTTAYRTGKFVRRHRVGVAASVLLVASVAAGVASTVHQARRAERRFQQVRSLANEFVFDVHDRIEHLPGSTEARKAIVTTGLRYLENLSQEAGGDAPLHIELAAAYERIGDVQGRPAHGNLGDSRGALGSYRRAEDLLKPLLARGDRRSIVPMASVLQRVGEVRAYLGEGGGAMEELERARQLLHDPQDLKTLNLAADIDIVMGRVALDMRNAVRSRTAAEEAMRLAQRMVALDPGSLETRDYLSQAQSALGKAYRIAGDLEPAARSFRAAVEIREQLVREQPGNTGYRRNLMVGFGNLGDILGLPRAWGLGDLAGAADALRKATEIAQWLRGSDPADRTARFDLASARFRLGTVLLAQDGRAAEALTELEQAQELLNGLVKEDPANVRYRFNYIYVIRKVGEALADLGRFAEATRRFVTARAMADSFKGTHNESEAQSGRVAVTVELAKLKAKAGDNGAGVLADECMEYLGKSPVTAANAWGRAVTYADLGGVYRVLGRRADGNDCLEKSANIYREMKVPAALDGLRRRELAGVVAALR